MLKPRGYLSPAPLRHRALAPVARDTVFCKRKNPIALAVGSFFFWVKKKDAELTTSFSRPPLVKLVYLSPNIEPTALPQAVSESRLPVSVLVAFRIIAPRCVMQWLGDLLCSARHETTSAFLSIVSMEINKKSAN